MCVAWVNQACSKNNTLASEGTESEGMNQLALAGSEVCHSISFSFIGEDGGSKALTYFP